MVRRNGAPGPEAASETMLTIAADPKQLGANVAITAVLHTGVG
jgi:hypothetical protein